MVLPATRDFGPPFDFADGDVYLRSVDGCCFRAHKAILCMASATIRDLGFDMAAAANDQQNGLPVHPFVAPGEEEGVIANFLRLVYLLGPPLFACTGDVRVLLELCRKYQAEVVITRLEQVLVAEPILKAHPLGLYALACVYRLEKVARAAAHESLRDPLLLQGLERKEDIVMLTGTDLYHLFEYRRKVADAAVAIALPSSTLNFNDNDARCWWTCQYCSSDSTFGTRQIVLVLKMKNHYARAWWVAYMKQCQVALKTTPLPEAVSRNDLVYHAVAKAGSCSTCVTSAAKDMCSFVPSFERAVEDATSKVRS
jgi:hypothetical protein